MSSEKELTEKEKSHLGQIYDPNDKELWDERIVARDLCYEFNHLHPSKVDEKQRILKKLLGNGI